MNLKEQWELGLDWVWAQNRAGAAGLGCRAGRVLVCTVRELSAGELTLRAMSLVYSTLLSLVPLLALAFSILKGLGIHNRIEPMLAAMLEPLGPSAAGLTQTVIGFVDNVKIGVLGSIGIALLFYTVLGMIQKVESSFNFIWKIPRQRPLTQRVSEYLVVLLLGPLVLTLVLGTTASLASTRLVETMLEFELIGQSIYLLGRLLPYVLIVGIFSFLFAFIPNTKVSWRAACAGGLVSGLMWQSAAWLFANFVASSGNYNAVYSSFAILILLLIWLYLAWLILLTGCQIAFFIQHPEYLTRHHRHAQASGMQRDILMLTLMGLVQQHFVHGKVGLRPTELARLSGAAPDLVNPLINNLLESGLLAETAAGELLPQHDPSRLSLSELLNSAYAPDLNSTALEERVNQPIQDLARRLEQARQQVLGDATLGDLLDRPGEIRRERPD